MVKWSDKDINEPHMIDSTDFNQDTSKINLEEIHRSLEREKVNSVELTKEYEEYEKSIKKEKRKRKKNYLLITTLSLLVIALIAVFGVSYMSKISILEKDADKYFSNGEYQNAAMVYKKLYEETGDSKYGESFKYMAKCRENEDLLFEASEDIRVKDYKNAIQVLLTIVTEREETIEKINQQLEEATNRWLEEIQTYYADRDIKNAYYEINEFVNLMPENVEAKELKEKILKDGNIKPENVDKAVDSKSKEEDKIRKRIYQKNYEKSKAMIGTEQYVVTNTANIRARHNINSNVLDTVKKGKGLYVEDTYVDNVEGFWCKVTYYSDKDEYVSGWISYSTLKGDI